MHPDLREAEIAPVVSFITEEARHAFGPGDKALCRLVPGNDLLDGHGQGRNLRNQLGDPCSG
ncbi:hypothetical protein D3C72_2356500 [compost metagenome]